jgi:lysozyme family protein
MDANFERCVAFVYEDEKGNDDDPADRGGRTSDGITQKEYSAWCRMHNSPALDIWTVPWATKKEIYRQQYWFPYCPRMPTGMDYLFFDTFVNSGLHEAALILQRTLGVKADGHIGLVTQQAVLEEIVDADWIDRFCADHEHVYNQIVAAHPQDRKFLHGWMNRIHHEKTNALALIKGA